MSDLLIRDVDEQLVQLLKSKAEVNGTSLQQEASKALRKGAPMTAAERLAIFNAIEKEAGGFPKVSTGGAELLRTIRYGDEDDT
ncbi:MAG: FitA-like ribbon-helix-helix domain-containing protein [Bosea sp. (in: a-proteobacteria)]